MSSPALKDHFFYVPMVTSQYRCDCIITKIIRKHGQHWNEGRYFFFLSYKYIFFPENYVVGSLLLSFDRKKKNLWYIISTWDRNVHTDHTCTFVYKHVFFVYWQNWTFSLWCVPMIKSGSLNWPWSTKILGQFVTHISVSLTSNTLWRHR